MAFHTYRIQHYGKDSSGAYVATPTELDNVLSIGINYALGEIADGFSVSLWNALDTDFDSIKIDDRFVISGKLADADDWTVLMDGTVNDKQASGSVSSHVITLTGLNRLEKLFNSLVATTGEAVQKTASDWIKLIIDQINNFNSQGGTNRNITYDNNSIYTTSNTFSFARSWEKSFKLIEELSQPDLNGEDVFLYWLDENNKFYWQPRSETVTQQIDWGEEILSFRAKKGMFDLVNYIILNAGKNAYGTTILDVGYDVESINKFGWKTKLLSNEGLSNTLKDADRNSKRSAWVIGESFPTSYPYITIWGDTINSDSEYNASLVEEVYVQSNKYLNGLLINTAESSYKFDLEVLPELGFALGEYTQLTIPEIGFPTGHETRLENINLSFNESGWSCNISLKDDAAFVREA